jgi:hypothetical protein
MTAGHNAIRGEVVCLQEALDIVIERGTFEIWELGALQQMWESHYGHVEAHPYNEDDKFQIRRERLPQVSRWLH